VSSSLEKEHRVSEGSEDIEAFYDEDERRRDSDEVELGTDWYDAQNLRYELSWITDTGELYLMREPNAAYIEEPFGPFSLRGLIRTKDVTVAVVGWIPTREQLDEVLAGWEGKVGSQGSLDWIAQRLEEQKVPAVPPSDR
jgi:hypothetical protein